MTQANEKIIARIQALLAKTTERGCTPQEAEAAAQKVAALMAVYQLSESDVAPKDQKNKRGEARCKYGKCEPWTLRLAAAVAQMTGTFHAYSAGTGFVFFYGTEDAVDAAVFSFNNLQEQAANMAYAYWKEQKKAGAQDWERGPAIRDYRYGVVNGIRNAIYEQQQQQKFAEQNTTALIVVNNSIKRAEEWAHQNTMFRTGRSRGSSIRNSAAFAQGYDDGRKVQRQPRLGG